MAYGGAVADVDAEATAFPHRDVRSEYGVAARWEDPSDDSRHAATCRRLAPSTEPWCVGVHVNVLGAEWPTRMQQAHGTVTYARSAGSTRPGPENVFRLNQNVRPS